MLLHVTRLEGAEDIRVPKDAQELLLRDSGLQSIDLAPLSSCSSLQTLGLGMNQLQTISLSPLSSCRNLQTIVLAHNELEGIDLSPLSALTNLRSVELMGNGFRSIDLSPLSSCISLQELYVNQNLLQSIDLTPLSSCISLQELNLFDNELRSIDLTPLSSCRSLRTLHLWYNKLQSIDLTPLSSCTGLEYIQLGDNPIQRIDLAPLKDLLHLSRFEISDTEISFLDVTALFYLKSLEVFSHGNALLLADTDKLSLGRSQRPPALRDLNIISVAKLMGIASSVSVANPKYEVALSFAGEQREYVRKVAISLRHRGVKVFYDEFEDVRMWGENLVEFLQYLFQTGCRHVVVFVSEAYANKFYPTLEKRSFLSDATKVVEGRILIVRFDNTELPGVPSAMRYLRAEDYTPAELAKRIAEKLKERNG